MRTCGPCTACCTVMGVDELRKQPGERCGELCASGCSVYENRPTSCREFECVWLRMEDHLRNMERPDQVGVMLDVNQENRMGEAVMVAREVWPGAFEEVAAKAMLQRLAKKVVIFLVNEQSKSRRMIGPEDDIRRIHRKLRVVA